MSKEKKPLFEDKDQMTLSQESNAEEFERDIGESGMPLCREPWENLYILRRGILPCCYGNPVGYSFPEYAKAWNSPEVQEIRRYLSRGKLSPYCMECLGCPIVQRYLAEHGMESPALRQRPFFLRFLNRLFFRIPSKIYHSLSKK
jgi:hypothetical protein